MDIIIPVILLFIGITWNISSIILNIIIQNIVSMICIIFGKINFILVKLLVLTNENLYLAILL